MKLIPSILLLVILCVPSFAQRPDAGDAVYAAGSFIDVNTSWGKREAGIFRDSNGRFAAGPNIAFKSGLWGGIKFLEWKMPRHRKAFFWTKIGIGAGYAAIGLFHNRKVH